VKMLALTCLFPYWAVFFISMLVDEVQASRFFLQKPSDLNIQTFLSKQNQGFNHPYQEITRGEHSENPGDVGFKSVIHLRKEVGHGLSDYMEACDIVLNWRVHEDSTWASIHTTTNSKRSFGRGTGFSRLDRNKKGNNLATLAKCYGGIAWVLNPCRLVYEEVDIDPYPQQQDSNDAEGNGNNKASWWPCVSNPVLFSATSYGTLRHHLICGEERVQVSMLAPPEEHNTTTGKKKLQQGSNSKCNTQNKDGTVIVEIFSVSRGATGLGTLLFPLMRNMQYRFFKEQVDTVAAKLEARQSRHFQS